MGEQYEICISLIPELEVMLFVGLLIELQWIIGRQK
jgi:hypothetical protein